MRFKSLAELLPFSRRASSVLVCETDGFTLRGAVIGQTGDGLVVLHAARSEAVEYKTAVTDIISILRKQGWTGDSTVLLTPGALSAIVELPVAPNSKRPPDQMLELVRWELEPLLMQHTTLWSVGRILVGLGFLTDLQATEVLKQQQSQNAAGGGVSSRDVFSFKRYGELAIEMGYINHRQMEECLTRQAWLQSSGEEIACGWTAQPAVDATVAESGQYPWLVCGVNQGMMQQWAQAFASVSVELVEVYPLVGCASTAPEVISYEAGDVLLLETHAGLVSGVRISSGAVTAINLQQSALKGTLDACLEAYHVLASPDVKAVWLASAMSGADGLEINLASMLGKPVNQLATVKGDVSSGMLGAARHAMSLLGATRCGAVLVNGPKVPLWNKVEFRALAAGLFLLLSVGAAELVLQLRQNLAEAEHEKAAKAAATMDEAVAKVQVRIDAIKAMKADIKAKNEAIDKLQKSIDLLTVDVPNRTALVQKLMNDLSITVPEDMVIDRIEESSKDGFKVLAWTLSEKSAQQFVKSFNAAMTSVGLSAVDVTVTPQTGRLSLQGYGLRFRAVNTQNSTAAVPETKKQ